MSLEEYEIANFLHETNTPFYSGQDPETLIGDDTRRSDDFVIPAVPGRHDGCRIEWGGLWNYPDEQRRTAYREKKNSVQEYHTLNETNSVLIVPTNRSGVPSKDELSVLLGDFLGFSDEVILGPTKVPASTVNTPADFLARVVEHFEPGSEISTTILKEHLEFGESFVVRMYTFFEGIHELADAAELFVAVAHYNETQSQFLTRLHLHFPEIQELPSSHELALTGYSWVNERADHFFGSYRNLREHLGLEQLRREPYTLDEARSLLSEMCENGISPATTDINNRYPGMVSFLNANFRLEVDQSFQVTLSRFLGTQMNTTRLPMASLDETISYLQDNSVNTCLPDIRANVLPSPIYRRLQHECIERSWDTWGLPVTASRLTGGLKPQRVKLEGRNVSAPPLIEQILEDLTRAVQTYGGEVVSEWDPTTLRNHEKRLSNNLGILARQIGLSKKLIHYDMLRIPWLERRDARNRIIRCTECWIGWSRDLQVRNPTDILSSKERQAYVNQFNKLYRTRFPNVESAFTAAREVEHPDWYVNHPFLDRIWESDTPFDEWIVLVSQ